MTDRRTNGQTDILPRHSPRYAYASRCKNANFVKTRSMYLPLLSRATCISNFMAADDGSAPEWRLIFQGTVARCHCYCSSSPSYTAAALNRPLRRGVYKIDRQPSTLYCRKTNAVSALGWPVPQRVVPITSLRSLRSRRDARLRDGDVGAEGDAGARVDRRRSGGVGRPAVLLVRSSTSRCRGTYGRSCLRHGRGADDRVVIAATAGRTTGPTRTSTARLLAISRVPAAQDHGCCGGALRGSTVQAVGGVVSLRCHQSYRDTSTAVKPLCQSTAWETANIYHPAGALISTTVQ